jgi:hypothetical protein
VQAGRKVEYGAKNMLAVYSLLKMAKNHVSHCASRKENGLFELVFV